MYNRNNEKAGSRSEKNSFRIHNTAEKLLVWTQHKLNFTGSDFGVVLFWQKEKFVRTAVPISKMFRQRVELALGTLAQAIPVKFYVTSPHISVIQ